MRARLRSGTSTGLFLATECVYRMVECFELANLAFQDVLETRGNEGWRAAYKHWLQPEQNVCWNQCKRKARIQPHRPTTSMAFHNIIIVEDAGRSW